MDEINVESSLKEGTVVPDKKNDISSPFTENFVMNQGSFEYVLTENQKRLQSKEDIQELAPIRKESGGLQS